MKMRKSTGPSTLPRGTPLTTLDHDEGALLTSTLCLWDVKNDDIQLTEQLEKLYFIMLALILNSLCNKISFCCKTMIEINKMCQ